MELLFYQSAPVATFLNAEINNKFSRQNAAPVSRVTFDSRISRGISLAPSPRRLTVLRGGVADRETVRGMNLKWRNDDKSN